MSEYKQTVTNTQDTGLADDGSAVQRETKHVSTDTVADGRTTASNIVWYIFGVIASLLALRFILKLLGANAGNGFVNFIYNLSSIFSAPFDTIFGVTSLPAGQAARSAFEPSIIVAILVYALIAWGITKLLNLNRNHA